MIAAQHGAAASHVAKVARAQAADRNPAKMRPTIIEEL